MASETFARTAFLAKRSTPVIDGNLDICSNNIGGHIVALPFTLVADATSAAGTKMKFVGSTNTYAVAFKSGSVVGIGVAAQTALGASRHATFTVYVGATSTGFAATIPASGQSSYTAQAKDTDTFAAGKKISVLCEHASNTTYTYSAIAYVEM